MTTDLWSAISRSLKEQKLPEKKTKTSADLNPPVINLTAVLSKHPNN